MATDAKINKEDEVQFAIKLSAWGNGIIVEGNRR